MHVKKKTEGTTFLYATKYIIYFTEYLKLYQNPKMVVNIY